MKYFLSFSAFFVLFAIYTNAAIIRVNNQPGISANATTLQGAHDIANIGDTIHLESSTLDYGAVTLTKQLVIIGTGYFLGSNPQTQALLAGSKIGSIYFDAGSENSVIMGCEISGKIYFRTSNICVMRNKINGNFEIGNSTSGANLTNFLIKQNYISWYAYNQGTLINNFNNPYVSNLHIKNNILIQTYTGGSYNILELNANFSGNIENNVIQNANSNSISIYNFTLKNNILNQGAVSLGNCQTFNNIANYTQFGTQDGNQSNVVFQDLFVGSTTTSPDGYYQLSVSSLASGAGENGTDCGVFGGSDPYVLSGMPGVPAIYYFSITGTGTQSQVKIKVKSHN